MIYIFSYHRSISTEAVNFCTEAENFNLPYEYTLDDSFIYGCPLSLIPGSHFMGTVQVTGSVISQNSYRRLTVVFDVDSIAELVDNVDVCTCADDEMNCDCDFIALEYYFRFDVHNAFLHLKDILPNSMQIKVSVKAGRYHTSFVTESKHRYDCPCDNFRNQIEIVHTSFDPFDVFLEKKTTTL